MNNNTIEYKLNKIEYDTFTKYFVCQYYNGELISCAKVLKEYSEEDLEGMFELDEYLSMQWKETTRKAARGELS